MNRGLYTSATGMVGYQQWLDVAANNLANISTTGFKADQMNFAESLLRTVRADGGRGPVLGTVSTGPRPTDMSTDFTKGSEQATGNHLDIMLESPRAMLKISTPEGIRFFRGGSLDVDQNRQLITKDGYPVLDRNDNPVTMPPNSYQITEDGRVMVDGVPTIELAMVTGTFGKAGKNQFVALGPVTDATDRRVLTGVLEGSNVSAIDAMVQMVRVQRLFEMAQRSVQQHDESTQRLIQTVTG